MFMTVRVGMQLTEIMTAARSRSREVFTRLDGNPMIAFPEHLDPGQAIVTGITVNPEGLMIEVTCSYGDAQFTKLWTKLVGPQVAIMSARVGRW